MLCSSTWTGVSYAEDILHMLTVHGQAHSDVILLRWGTTTREIAPWKQHVACPYPDTVVFRNANAIDRSDANPFCTDKPCAWEHISARPRGTRPYNNIAALRYGLIELLISNVCHRRGSSTIAMNHCNQPLHQPLHLKSCPTIVCLRIRCQFFNIIYMYFKYQS